MRQLDKIIFSRFPKPLLFSLNYSSIPTKQVVIGSLLNLSTITTLHTHPLLHTTQQVLIYLFYSSLYMTLLSMLFNASNVIPRHYLHLGVISSIMNILRHGFYSSLDNLTRQQSSWIYIGI